MNSRLEIFPKMILRAYLVCVKAESKNERKLSVFGSLVQNSFSEPLNELSSRSYDTPAPLSENQRTG